MSEGGGGWLIDGRVSHVPGQIKGCPEGQRNAGERECPGAVKAAAAKIGKFYKGLKTVSWGKNGVVPAGCSFSHSTKRATWNRNPDGRSSSMYSLVCIDDGSEATHDAMAARTEARVAKQEDSESGEGEGMTGTEAAAEEEASDTKEEEDFVLNAKGFSSYRLGDMVGLSVLQTMPCFRYFRHAEGTPGREIKMCGDACLEYNSNQCVNPPGLTVADFHLQKWPHSLAADYLRATDQEEDFEALAGLVRKYNASVTPAKSAAVVHLHVGEILEDYHKDVSVDALLQGPEFCEWKEIARTDLLRKGGVGKTKQSDEDEELMRHCYVLNASYYKRQIKKLQHRGPNVKDVVLVAVSPNDASGMGFRRSSAYIRGVRRLFKAAGYRVHLRLGQKPDDDFALMSRATYFVQGGGGFSILIAGVVAELGGTVLRDDDRADQAGHYKLAGDVTPTMEALENLAWRCRSPSCAFPSCAFSICGPLFPPAGRPRHGSPAKYIDPPSQAHRRPHGVRGHRPPTFRRGSVLCFAGR